MENQPMLGLTSHRYSEALKQKVVEEVSKGKISIAQARRNYDIRGHMTIQRWMRDYDKSLNIRKEVVFITKKNESMKVKQLKKEKQELESALAQAQLKIISLESTLEVISEEYGDDLKKKLDTGQLKKRKRK